MPFCKKCNQDKLEIEMSDGRKGPHSNKSTCNKCRFKSQAQWKKNHPKVSLVQWARHRAKVNDIPFNLTSEDIVIPEYCPVLKIKLEPGEGKLHDTSPTLDRIKSELGYVKGNVIVISYKANRMKNNGTLEELENLVNWLKQTDNTEGRPEKEPVTTNTPNSIADLLTSYCDGWNDHRKYIEKVDKLVKLKIESELAGDSKRAPLVTQVTAA